MEKVSILVTYNVKYWVSDFICLTICGKVINTKTGKELKQFLRGNKKSVYIDSKPIDLNALKPFKKQIRCPF